MFSYSNCKLSNGYSFEGSIYLLLIIASQPGLASWFWSKGLPSTVLFALCNNIRWPQDLCRWFFFLIVLHLKLSLVSSSFVVDRLVPAISKLQKIIPLQMPTLYSSTVQKKRKVPATLHCQDIRTSDHYFDSFHQRFFTCLLSLYLY